MIFAIKLINFNVLHYHATFLAFVHENICKCDGHRKQIVVSKA